jgi:Reverse transcriptase (RNA-dependent DNA polymerase)
VATHHCQPPTVMNDTGRSLTELNCNVNFDLKLSSNFLFEDDNWPNPYLEVKLNSLFYDPQSFIHKFRHSKCPIFISINIQSLVSKHSALSEFISCLIQHEIPIIAIALQETWYVQYPDVVNIPGFKFIYRPRNTGRGGGVGFYLKEELSYKILNTVDFVDSQFEHLTIETVIAKRKYILCNIYRAPNNREGDSLRDLIETYNQRLEGLMQCLNQPHHLTLIFSDCNINMLKLNTSQLTAEYLDTCHTNGFYLSNLKATRFQNDNFSLIDHILSDNLNGNIDTGSILIDVSDHLPTFYTCDDLVVSRDRSRIVSRNFSHANLAKFRDALRTISWADVTSTQNVDTALDNFMDTFSTFFDLHFPLTSRRRNRNFDKLNGFMTAGLLVSRRQKNKLFKLQILHPTYDNVNSFRIYRNIYNSTLRKSKKLFYESCVCKYKSKPKKLWDFLNSLNGKSRCANKIDEVLVGQNIINNDKDIAQAFNDHFSSAGTFIQNSIIDTEVDPMSFVPDNPDVPEFFVNGLGPVHITDVIKALPAKCSTDINNISMKLVKFVAYEICIPLSHIFRLSIDNGIFPTKFKNSRIVPIFKNGDSKLCDNYRPIALVNTFSKILEKIVATDLYNHLDLNQLLYKHQYGFQRGKSTEHNLIQVVNFIGNALNAGDWCIGVFLDLKKAFDTVQHNILLKKLEKFGISGNILEWFRSYLSNRTQCVDINGSLSDLRDIIMSVMQGSSLGPILFLCFINDIFTCTNLALFLFADDSNALAQNPNLSELIDFVNAELQKLAVWFRANRLSVNAEKTKFMIFRTKNRVVNMQGKDIYLNFNDIGTRELPHLKFKLARVFNEAPPGQQTYKMLGVIFDEFLTFNQHLTYMQSKISKSLFLLRRSKNVLPKKALKLLYFSLIHCHLTYCPLIYSICSKTQIKKLSILQKKAVRIISGLGYNDHTAPYFLSNDIMPLELIIKNSTLLFMHSVKYRYCPKSFYDVFVLNNDDIGYELRYYNEFILPRARIELFKRIPLYYLPFEWNNSGDLKFYQNRETFRIILRETLMREFATNNNISE